MPLLSSALKWFAVAALFAASAAQAEEQEPILRCLTATSSLASSSDKGIAQIGVLNSLYWLGRLDPSLSEAVIEKRIAAISASMTKESLQAEVGRCGRELAERGAMMERIGKKLKDRAARRDTR